MSKEKNGKSASLPLLFWIVFCDRPTFDSVNIILYPECEIESFLVWEDLHVLILAVNATSVWEGQEPNERKCSHKLQSLWTEVTAARLKTEVRSATIQFQQYNALSMSLNKYSKCYQTNHSILTSLVILVQMLTFYLHKTIYKKKKNAND